MELLESHLGARLAPRSDHTSPQTRAGPLVEHKRSRCAVREARMPSRGKWVADPILHGGIADTHWMCDGRWTSPYTDQTVARGNAPGELRPQCGEPGSTGIGRSRFAPALVAPVRQREVTAIVVRRNPPSARLC